MSIINDALKKAQQRLKGKIKTNASGSYEHLLKDSSLSYQTPSHDEPVEIKKKNPWFKNILYISSIITFISINFLIFYAIDRLKTKTPSVGQTAGVQDQQPDLLPGQANIPPPPPESELSQAPESTGTITSTADALLLKGTIMMGEKRVALINDDLYEVGEDVRGIKILEITLKNIKVQYANGEVKFLRTGENL